MGHLTLDFGPVGIVAVMCCAWCGEGGFGLGVGGLTTFIALLLLFY